MSVDSAISEIFLTLSEIFKPPEDIFSGQLASSQVQSAMDGWMQEAGYRLEFPAAPAISAEGEPAFFLSLREEYMSLFEGPMPPFIPLIESVHKPWDKTGVSALGAQTGYFLGDPAIDMRNKYEAAQLEIPAEYGHAPDHLCLLLEYYGAVHANVPVADNLEYLTNHFDWLALILEEAVKISSALFYPSMLKFTMDIIAAETARLNGLKE